MKELQVKVKEKFPKVKVDYLIENGASPIISKFILMLPDHFFLACLADEFFDQAGDSFGGINRFELNSVLARMRAGIGRHH